jgi:hypothetical protein
LIFKFNHMIKVVGGLHYGLSRMVCVTSLFRKPGNM